MVGVKVPRLSQKFRRKIPTGVVWGWLVNHKLLWYGVTVMTKYLPQETVVSSLGTKGSY